MSGIAATVATETVKTAAGGSISAGIWTLVGLVVTTCATVLTVWWKQGPVWKKTELDGDAQIRAELDRVTAALRADIGKLTLKDEDKGRRLTVAETRISQQDSQIGQLRFLVALMNSELERVNPGNPIARQVRIMMEEIQHQASSSNAEETGIMADAMSKLCAPDGEK